MKLGTKGLVITLTAATFALTGCGGGGGGGGGTVPTTSNLTLTQVIQRLNVDNSNLSCREENISFGAKIANFSCDSPDGMKTLGFYATQDEITPMQPLLDSYNLAPTDIRGENFTSLPITTSNTDVDTLAENIDTTIPYQGLAIPTGPALAYNPGSTLENFGINPNRAFVSVTDPDTNAIIYQTEILKNMAGEFIRPLIDTTSFQDKTYLVDYELTNDFNKQSNFYGVNTISPSTPPVVGGGDPNDDGGVPEI